MHKTELISHMNTCERLGLKTAIKRIIAAKLIPPHPVWIAYPVSGDPSDRWYESPEQLLTRMRFMLDRRAIRRTRFRAIQEGLNSQRLIAVFPGDEDYNFKLAIYEVTVTAQSLLWDSGWASPQYRPTEEDFAHNIRIESIPIHRDPQTRKWLLDGEDEINAQLLANSFEW